VALGNSLIIRAIRGHRCNVSIDLVEQIWYFRDATDGATGYHASDRAIHPHRKSLGPCCRPEDGSARHGQFASANRQTAAAPAQCRMIGDGNVDFAFGLAIDRSNPSVWRSG
jgi:hypothetical protein